MIKDERNALKKFADALQQSIGVPPKFKSYRWDLKLTIKLLPLIVFPISQPQMASIRNGIRKMSDAHFYTIFCILSVLFLLPSLWARFNCSGAQYSDNKALIVRIYNATLFFIHLNFIQNEQLPFIGHKDPNPTGWISFAMLILYIHALPTRRTIAARHIK